MTTELDLQGFLSGFQKGASLLSMLARPNSIPGQLAKDIGIHISAGKVKTHIDDKIKKKGKKPVTRNRGKRDLAVPAQVYNKLKAHGLDDDVERVLGG